jgi:uncharacterized damage-inducible protein DinB
VIAISKARTATRVSSNGITDPREPTVIDSITATLRQLSDLLGAMTDEQYTRKPVGVVPSSIGGHVRHCLDHVEALLAGVECGAFDYDQRRRGTDIETSRLAALKALRRHERQLQGLADSPLTMLLWLSALVGSHGPIIEVRTSLGRELAFVLSHTIHHNALIGVMAKLLDVPVPERFGYAPSTIAHLEKASCAR